MRTVPCPRSLPPGPARIGGSRLSISRHLCISLGLRCCVLGCSDLRRSGMVTARLSVDPDRRFGCATSASRWLRSGAFGLAPTAQPGQSPQGPPRAGLCRLRPRREGESREGAGDGGCAEGPRAGNEGEARGCEHPRRVFGLVGAARDRRRRQWRPVEGERPRRVGGIPPRRTDPVRRGRWGGRHRQSSPPVRGRPRPTTGCKCGRPLKGGRSQPHHPHGPVA